MQMNKELLERALAEGVDCSYSETYINPCVSLATDSNDRYTGFYLTNWQYSTSSWTYVCTCEEYLKAKSDREQIPDWAKDIRFRNGSFVFTDGAGKAQFLDGGDASSTKVKNWTLVTKIENTKVEKMQEFKAGDLVCVTHKVGEFLPINRYGELKYISDQSVIIRDNGNELIFSRDNCELKPHRKTQDWFGVEIDAFMTEKPKDGKLYYLWSLCGDVVEPNGWANDDFDSGLFDMGVWDSEEKAKRSVPLMRQRLIEMAGVSCKEK